MPKVELRELTPQEQALAARVGELLRGAKPGETVTLPPDLAQALDDAARSAAAPAIIARRRLEWLHSRDACNVDGYEWGVFRVKWENGRAVEVWQTNADFSDLDAAMVAAGVNEPLAPSSDTGSEVRRIVALVEHAAMKLGNAQARNDRENMSYWRGVLQRHKPDLDRLFPLGVNPSDGSKQR